MNISRITIIALLAAAPFVSAEDTKKANADVGQYWNFDLGLELLSLDSEQATQERVKDSATALGFYANYLNKGWVTSIRSSFVMYSDNGGFSQTVVGTGTVNEGEIESRSSDADGMTLGIASGKRWRFGENLGGSAVLQVGYDQMFESKRSISSCSNCRSESIDIDAGPFIHGAIRHTSDRFSVGLSLSRYFGDEGLSNRVSIIIGSSF